MRKCNQKVALVLIIQIVLKSSQKVLSLELNDKLFFFKKEFFFSYSVLMYTYVDSLKFFGNLHPVSIHNTITAKIQNSLRPQIVSEKTA